MRLVCDSRRVYIDGREINLTAKEFEVLELLIPRLDLQYVKRFGDIVVGAVVKSQDLIHVLAFSGILLKNKLRNIKILRSLKSRIFLILLIVGLIPCVSMRLFSLIP